MPSIEIGETSSSPDEQELRSATKPKIIKSGEILENITVFIIVKTKAKSYSSFIPTSIQLYLNNLE